MILVVTERMEEELTGHTGCTCLELGRALLLRARSSPAMRVEGGHRRRGRTYWELGDGVT